MYFYNIHSIPGSFFLFPSENFLIYMDTSFFLSITWLLHSRRKYQHEKNNTSGMIKKKKKITHTQAIFNNTKENHWRLRKW